MGWSAQYFTTIIIEGNTPQTGIFIYNGAPSLGNLIGSWAAAAGTDAFGNSYPAGINVSQGVLQGVGISNATVTATNILSSVIASSILNNNTINAGTINETTIIFDSGGGMLFGYTSTTTTVTKTAAGDYTFTSPIDGTGSITLIAAGAGGDGGNSGEGGNGGGAGECAQEPNYPLVNGQNYLYTVGAGGTGNSTNGGHGNGGGDSTFDIGGSGGGIFANGGDGDGTGGTGSSNSVHHDGGTGGAASGFNGGASGGNSGNSTAKGNNGSASTGNTGAAQPAAQTGSGRGGAGGSTNANGSNGGSPGAGGGGAGNGGSNPTSQSISYAPTWNQSYYGPDATNGQPNKKRTTGVMYQGGETASGGAANGNQRSVYAFNRAQMASDFAGYTITACEMQLKCLHSWYNSGMTWTLDEYQSLPGSAPSSFPAGDYVSTDASGTISTADGNKVISLSTSIAVRFVTGASNGLGHGETLAATHPYNVNYYGYFDPSQMRFKITGTTGGAGITTAGNGADGQSVITYSTASVLECAISPTAGTDPNGNNYAAGYTGPVSQFDPTTPTNVEGWHNVGALSNGWTYQSDNLARYKLISNNLVMVEIHINDSSATSGLPFTMPAAYQPTVSQFVQIGIISGATADSVATIQITTGGAFNILNWAKQSKQYAGNVIYSLD